MYFATILTLSLLPVSTRCAKEGQSELYSWYQRLQDPNQECTSLVSKEPGPSLYEVVGCDLDGARWDYNLKVNRHKVLKPIRSQLMQSSD